MVVLLDVFYTNFNTINSFFNICNINEIESKKNEIIKEIQEDIINGNYDYDGSKIKIIPLEKLMGLTFAHSELCKYV